VKVTLDYTKYNQESYDYTQSVRTLTPTATYSKKSTQTTLTIYNIDALSDESCQPHNIVVKFSNKEHPYNGKSLFFDNLNPATNYPIILFADYNGKKIQLNTNGSCSTKDIAFEIKQEIGPTTANLKVIYEQGDAKVVKTWWDTDISGQELTAVSLIPEHEYSFCFNVETDKGYKKSQSFKIKTIPLELQTLEPRCPSEKTAIVAAKTNIADVEPNVGFQWKKFNAPESLKPSEGFGAVYDGMAEGYIKNLQPEYYKVRAFYKTSSDSYYYGDWVTFDPTDFSFFEPTVHTYPAMSLSDFNATLKGYVMNGTDEITSQGFEYWPTNGSSKAAARAYSTPTGVQTVFSKGQVMTAEISGLTADTEYTCRAFVETKSGVTYGEDRTFRTTRTSGIESITTDTPERTVIGYFDLNGYLYNEPRQGLNIVVYSDGTTKKIIVR